MNFRGLVKKVIPTKLFARIEPFGHMAEAMLFNVIYGFPARGLKVIGVTGTNGKTTTSFMIHNMLERAGYSVGLLTTVGYGMGRNIQPQVEHMTTMPAPQLLKRIKWLKKQGAKWVVLEVTSHGLAQNRVWGVPFSLAVMTNVTHEHLEYHGTFERYLEAKRKLFKLTGGNRRGFRTGIINADDPSAEKFAGDVPQSVTYGVKSGLFKATDVQLTPSGSTFSVSLPERGLGFEAAVEQGKAGLDKLTGSTKSPLKVSTLLPGSFNVYNCLAAVCAGWLLGLNESQIQQGISSLKGVEGRMFRVAEGQDYDLIVDYAHTPDSFEKLFKDIKPVTKGKLIVMFGSAGRRDTAKRAVQGSLAGKYADVVIVTEEDDRDEDGMEILRQIATGAEKSGKKQGTDLFLVHDRTEAIRFTIAKAGKGDTVLLLGKGHEKNIERAHGFDAWDEVATAKEAIKKART